MWQHGHFYWNELMTRDVQTAKTFYESALGWTFDEMPMEMGSYWVAKSGDDVVGGMMTMDGPDFEGVPEHWFAYIAVDDIDARLKKAVDGGAKVVRDPFDVPGVGRIAILSQPGGGYIGWMTPAPMEE